MHKKTFHDKYGLTALELSALTGASIRTCQNWVTGTPIHDAYKRLLDLHINMQVITDKRLLIDNSAQVIWLTGIGGEQVSFAELSTYWLKRNIQEQQTFKILQLEKQVADLQSAAQKTASEDRQTPSHAAVRIN